MPLVCSPAYRWSPIGWETRFTSQIKSLGGGFSGSRSDPTLSNPASPMNPSDRIRAREGRWEFARREPQSRTNCSQKGRCKIVDESHPIVVGIRPKPPEQVPVQPLIARSLPIYVIYGDGGNFYAEDIYDELLFIFRKGIRAAID
jgi:hypothetical protein